MKNAKPINLNSPTLPYLIGAAIGDGNLSRFPRDVIRLRITCDTKYPVILETIQNAIQSLLPQNKVSIAKCKGRCVDVYCFSKRWESILGWEADAGSKIKQNVSIPEWIKNDTGFSIQCLKGLIETDGSIYKDRGYLMVNFTSEIQDLANDVLLIINNLGFNAHIYKAQDKNRPKYTVRVSKNTENFIRTLNLQKS